MVNGLNQILEKVFEGVLLEIRYFLGFLMSVNGVRMRFYSFVCSGGLTQE